MPPQSPAGWPVRWLRGAPACGSGLRPPGPGHVSGVAGHAGTAGRVDDDDPALTAHPLGQLLDEPGGAGGGVQPGREHLDRPPAAGQADEGLALPGGAGGAGGVSVEAGAADGAVADPRRCSRPASGRPRSAAKREAPAPASRTWRPSSRTARATLTGLAESVMPATAPVRSLSAVITPASSSTSPSALRTAPIPALKCGSSSSAVTAATTAESAPSSRARQPVSSARSRPASISARGIRGSHRPAPPWTIRVATGTLWTSRSRLPREAVTLAPPYTPVLRYPGPDFRASWGFLWARSWRCPMSRYPTLSITTRTMRDSLASSRAERCGRRTFAT